MRGEHPGLTHTATHARLRGGGATLALSLLLAACGSGPGEPADEPGSAGQSAGGSGGAGGSSGQGGAGQGGRAGAAGTTDQAGTSGAGKAGSAGSSGQAGGGIAGQASQGGQAGAAGQVGAAGQAGGTSGAGGNAAPTAIDKVEVVGCEVDLPAVPGSPPAVAQGSPWCLKLTGVGLDEIVEGEVGEAKAQIDGMVPGGALKMHFQIPHGVPLGPRTLLLVLAGGGTKVVTDLLTVTPIFVADVGSDQLGKGTEASPFRTLDHALGQANGGASLGDVVALLSDHKLTGPITVPAGVDLDGQGHAVTSDSADGIVQLMGKNRVSSATFVAFPGDALHVLGDKVDLIDVSASNNAGYGLAILKGGAVKASGECAFSSNFSGVTLYGGGLSFAAIGCTFQDNTAEGVAAESGAAVTLEGCLVEGNGALDYSGVSISQGASLELISSTLRNNVASNLLGTNEGPGFKTGKPGLIHLKNSVISGSNIGLHLLQSPQVIIEGLTLSGAASHGLLVRQGTHLTLSGDLAAASCVIEANAGAGLVIEGGSAEITGCILRHNGAEGIAAAGTLSLAGSVLDGNGADGIHASGGPSLAVSESAVSGHGVGLGVEAGAGLLSLSVKGGSFDQNQRAIVDEGGVAGPLQISQVSFTGQGTEAIFLRSAGATATIEGCLFASDAPAGAEIVLDRPLASGVPPVTLSGLTFDASLAPDPGQLRCPPDTLVALGGKTRLTNLGAACFSW